MPANTAKLTSIVEEYLVELRRLRDSGGATAEPRVGYRMSKGEESGEESPATP